jgi:hypothetical protein
MSSNVSFAGYADAKVDTRERNHMLLVYLSAAIAVGFILFLAIYGFDYYWLSSLNRPFSPKHALLKPSGTIGVKLGVIGVGLFLVIFLYPLRKKVKWLGQRGTSKHWLDFHVVAGMSAPIIIAFHSSFKFRGIAGVAFWIMFAVAVSGVVGRYLYAQIPRSLNAAQGSLEGIESSENDLTHELAVQHMFPAWTLRPLLAIPTAEQVRRMSVTKAMLVMFAIDMMRPFHIARLRCRVLGWGGVITSMGGLFRTSNLELERIIAAARRKSSLAKKVAFLSRTQQVFQLWHVVHRPFSYSFAILAVIHIVIVTMLGFTIW